jgi:hypothetical protein
MKKNLMALALLLPLCQIPAFMEPGIREEIFRADTAVVVRAQPEAKADRIRIMKKGSYVDGTLQKEKQVIQDRPGVWLAIYSDYGDHFVFTGFMKRVTDTHRKDLPTDCTMKDAVLKCKEFSAPVSQAVMVYIFAQGCPGTKLYSAPIKINSSGVKEAQRGIQQYDVPNQFEIFREKKSGEVVQIKLYGVPPEC